MSSNSNFEITHGGAGWVGQVGPVSQPAPPTGPTCPTNWPILPLLRQSTEVAFTLTNAVSKIFGQTSAAILILKDMSVMIYQSRHNERCFLFDSHSRNDKGMPTHNGKSILMTFEDSSDLVLSASQMLQNWYTSKSLEWKQCQLYKECCLIMTAAH